MKLDLSSWISLRPSCKHKDSSADIRDGIVWIDCPDCGLLIAMHPEQYAKMVEHDSR